MSKAIDKHFINVTHHYGCSGTKIKKTDNIILKWTCIPILMNIEKQACIVVDAGLHMHKGHN